MPVPQNVARGGGRDFCPGIRESSEIGVTVCEVRFQWGLGGDKQTGDIRSIGKMGNIFIG